MGGRTNAFKGFGGETPLGRPRCRWKDNNKMDLQVVEWGAMDWIDLALDRVRWWALVNVVMNLWVPLRCRGFLD